MNNNRLYVENLPVSVTESGIRELFSKEGSVTEVKLMKDASTGQSRGRAFVTMASQEVAEAALKSLHSHSLGGRHITVSVARPVEERPTGLIGHGFETGIGDKTTKDNNAGGKNNHRGRGNGGKRRRSR
ncbi:MAG: RNA-binding protein domain [Pedosphaera sp.]|nr:RNA-binding protein domain [Pedosphaera sp.]